MCKYNCDNGWIKINGFPFPCPACTSLTVYKLPLVFNRDEYGKICTICFKPLLNCNC